MLGSASKYIIKSICDDQSFVIDQKVIDSSSLLKNLCRFTQVTDPIKVDCPGSVLKTFINFIYEHEFGKTLLVKFSDRQLADFIKETCILDCDVLLDSLADIVISRLQNLNIKEIQEYLRLQDDYTSEERAWIDAHQLEFLVSANQSCDLPTIQFPFECSSFCYLKSKFESPLNVLLARVCQRANEQLAFRLSKCCKALKNECDRQPIKVSALRYVSDGCQMYIDADKVNEPFYSEPIFPSVDDDKCFETIIKRKVMQTSKTDVRVFFKDPKEYDFPNEGISLDWVVPRRNQVAEFILENLQDFYSYFGITRCPFSRIFFNLTKIDAEIDFDLMVEKLIIPGISKEIEIYGYDQFTTSVEAVWRLYKKPNSSKFYKFKLGSNLYSIIFKPFVMKYMEDDGVIICPKKFSNISDDFLRRSNEGQYYLVSEIKYFL